MSCSDINSVAPLEYLLCVAQGIQSAAAGTCASTTTPELWSTTISVALKKLYTYTHARLPSRTLVDPLAAFIDASPPVTPTLLAPPATAAKKGGSLSPASAPQHADFLAALQCVCTAVVAAEPEITCMDTIAGNGNCGLEF
jgi:hypothetical protein